VVLGVLACGGPGDPVSACDDAVQAVCAKLYRCNDATTIQKTLGYTDEGDCETKAEAAANCSTAGCPLGTKYQSNNASACIDDYQNLACDDTTTPTSCSEVCQ
jgi:hypothetical protein